MWGCLSVSVHVCVHVNVCICNSPVCVIYLCVTAGCMCRILVCVLYLPVCTCVFVYLAVFYGTLLAFLV